jgi:hypothetical protein
VQVIPFALVLVGSVLLALGIARVALGAMLFAMTTELPFAGALLRWRRVATVGALFWLAYLVPALAASESLQAPVARFVRLFVP